MKNNNEMVQKTEKTALRLIARAEQCSAGLARKLEKRGFEASCINTVISRLTEQQLIDDMRYARLWIESRLRLARSPLRLLASLCNRGIDRNDAQAALNAVIDEETELAILTRFLEKKMARKKRKTAGGENDNIRALKYLLKSEGFSARAMERFFEA